MTLRVAMVSSPLGGPASRVHPIGAMTIGSYLKHHLGSAVEVKIFNCGGSNAERLKAQCAIWTFNPAVVGFPIYSGHVFEVSAWASTLRTELPGAIFVAGGPHVTLTHKNFISKWGHLFDYSVAGDGESAMLALVRAALSGKIAECHDARGLGYIESGNVCANEPDVLAVGDWVNPFLCEVIDDGGPLQFSDRRDGKLRDAIALISSRSCPQRCSFCAIVAMPGKWRAAPTAHMLEWLEGEYRRKPFEHIYFLDANFFVSPRRVRELIAAIANRFPGMSWSTSSTVGYLLKMADDMPWLIANGLRAMELGLESGSAEQLKFLNKIATVPQNLDAVALVKRHGLELGLDFIMFYPDQTIELLRENLTFLMDADLVDEDAFDHLLTALELYPGTPLRTLYEERCGAAFDPDELPDIEALFVDDRVRNVYRIFFQEFVPNRLPSITDKIKALTVAEGALRASDVVTAQRHRLEITLLRHVTFKMLWRLCDAPFAQGAVEAWPWLATFDGTSTSIATLATEQLAVNVDMAA